MQHKVLILQYCLKVTTVVTRLQYGNLAQLDFDILICFCSFTAPPISCPVDYCSGVVAEVCGSDHVTYINNCYLEMEACRNPEKKLRAKEIGKCPEVDPREKMSIEGVDGEGDCDKEDPEDCAVDVIDERKPLALLGLSSKILLNSTLVLNLFLYQLYVFNIVFNCNFLSSLFFFFGFFQIFVHVLQPHFAEV